MIHGLTNLQTGLKIEDNETATEESKNQIVGRDRGGRGAVRKETIEDGKKQQMIPKQKI